MSGPKQLQDSYNCFCLVYPKAYSLPPGSEFLESFQDNLLDSIWRENITLTDIHQLNITNRTINDPRDVCDSSTECIDDGRGDISVNKVGFYVGNSRFALTWEDVMKLSNEIIQPERNNQNLPCF
jgi:hypothetical protein